MTPIADQAADIARRLEEIQAAEGRLVQPVPADPPKPPAPAVPTGWLELATRPAVWIYQSEGSDAPSAPTP